MILAPKWLVNVYVSMFMYVCVVVEFSLKSLYGTTKTRAERWTELTFDPSLLDMLTSDKIDALLSKSIMSDK